MPQEHAEKAAKKPHVKDIQGGLCSVDPEGQNAKKEHFLVEY